MALSLTELDAFVHAAIIPRTTDVIHKRSGVFTRLSTRNAERFTGGRYIQRPIMYGSLTGGAFDKSTSTLDISYVQTDTALVVNMKYYYVNITLYGIDAVHDQGPNAVFSQVETKFANASLTMAKLLATDMYLNDLSARSANLTGFDMWYDDGNTYSTIGSIDRDDIYPRGSVGGLNAYTATLANGFTLPDLERAYGQAQHGSDHVDLIVVTQNAYDQIWRAMLPNQRYVSREGDLTEAGFETFRFNAADVVVCQYLSDAFADSTPRIFGMNTNYIEWYFSNNDLWYFGFTGFKYAANTVNVSGQFLVACNTVVPNPRTGFKLICSDF